ncbi:hypothetical protein BRARA_C04439 [Brassica rapa]|uniref:Uncharacterized protein n=1 Tax=Brassica campestris TaxID=3711 RepID=A0A398AAC2_BRACM|nr:hypothetical protein BRARA_C04439 [Brassica rapa]
MKKPHWTGMIWPLDRLQTPPQAPEAFACSRSGKISDVKTQQTGPIPIGKNATFSQTKRRSNVMPSDS